MTDIASTPSHGFIIGFFEGKPVIASPQIQSFFEEIEVAAAGIVEGAEANKVWAHTGLIDLSASAPTLVNLLSGLSGVDDIYIFLDSVSTSAANTSPIIRIGDSGGLKVAGYDGEATYTSATANSFEANSTGWLLNVNNWFGAADTGLCVIRLHHVGANKWVMKALTIMEGKGVVVRAAGSVTLSNELTQVALTTEAGTATFDNGTAWCDSI